MSYCRFSSDNWASDLYAYEVSGDKFVIHVANNRVVGDVPKMPPLPDPIDLDNAAENVSTWLKAHRAQMAFLETAKREPIDLPHAGECFTLPDLESFIAKLLELRELGYCAPEHAIVLAREELASESKQ